MIAAESDADGQAVCWELRLAHLRLVITLTHCLTLDLEHYV